MGLNLGRHWPQSKVLTNERGLLGLVLRSSIGISSSLSPGRTCKPYREPGPRPWTPLRSPLSAWGFPPGLPPHPPRPPDRPCLSSPSVQPQSCPGCSLHCGWGHWWCVCVTGPHSWPLLRRVYAAAKGIFSEHNLDQVTSLVKTHQWPPAGSEGGHPVLAWLSPRAPSSVPLLRALLPAAPHPCFMPLHFVGPTSTLFPQSSPSSL